MQHHLSQSEHNRIFLDCINTNFPDSFYDWKITISFYIAIHLLKALGENRGRPLGHTHHEIFMALGPKANPKLFQIPDIQWKNYYTIFKYSQAARYDGFIDKVLYDQIQKSAYEHCAESLGYFQSYIDKQINQPAK